MQRFGGGSTQSYFAMVALMEPLVPTSSNGATAWAYSCGLMAPTMMNNKGIPIGIY